MWVGEHGGRRGVLCLWDFFRGRVRWEVEKNVERNIYESAHGNKKLFRSCFAGFFRNVFSLYVISFRIQSSHSPGWGGFGGRGKTEDMIESDRSMKRSRLVKSFSFVLCLGRGTKWNRQKKKVLLQKVSTNGEIYRRILDESRARGEDNWMWMFSKLLLLVCLTFCGVFQQFFLSEVSQNASKSCIKHAESVIIPSLRSTFTR